MPMARPQVSTIGPPLLPCITSPEWTRTSVPEGDCCTACTSPRLSTSSGAAEASPETSQRKRQDCLRLDIIQADDGIVSGSLWPQRRRGNDPADMELPEGLAGDADLPVLGPLDGMAVGHDEVGGDEEAAGAAVFRQHKDDR